MGEEKNSRGYSFTYSADQREKERSEIERIRLQYMEDGSNNKMDRLRALDRKVKNPALIIALFIGIFGTLVLGSGLSVLLVLDKLWAGGVIGIAGLVIASLAYPCHQLLIKKGKQKYSAEIIKLCNELLD